MTSKERILRAVAHREPDRVPVFATFTPEVQEALAKVVGCDEPELGVRLGNDMVLAEVGMARSYYGGACCTTTHAGRGRAGDTYVDEWGMTWQWVDQGDGSYTEIVERPLADAGVSDLQRYPWPDLRHEEHLAEARALVDRYGATHAVMGGLVFTMEAAVYLRGLERFLQDLLVNRAFATTLLDTVTDLHMEAVLELVRMGVDIVWVADDVGTQRAMMMSPDLWREVFKPRYASVFRRLREANPDVRIAYHSDGYIWPIIPDLIEAGLDILNPIQPWAMDPAAVKQAFGDRLCLWGTMDVQGTFPFGTPQDVAEETRLRIRTVAPGGGLILAPSHNIQADTKVENVFAFYDAARKYGVYPVS